MHKMEDHQANTVRAAMTAVLSDLVLFPKDTSLQNVSNANVLLIFIVELLHINTS
jgi:hypothetical protein